MKNLFFNILVLSIVSYIALILYFYTYQLKIMYTPIIDKPVPVDWGAENPQIIKVRTKDNILLEGWFYPPHLDNKVVVYFHGNGQHIGSTFVGVNQLLDDGYGLLMVEYRGYAGHDGKVSESGLYKDARAFLNWLHIDQDIKYENMIFFGESMGSALAIQMANEHKAHALILFAAFSSIVDVAKFNYPYLPVSFIVKDKYLNSTKIANVNNIPVLIVHGTMDDIADVSLARMLFVAAKEPKYYIELEKGTHMNLYELGAIKTVRGFLKKIN